MVTEGQTDRRTDGQEYRSVFHAVGHDYFCWLTALTAVLGVGVGVANDKFALRKSSRSKACRRIRSVPHF